MTARKILAAENPITGIRTGSYMWAGFCIGWGMGCLFVSIVNGIVR